MDDRTLAIRFESIGGLGADMAAEALATAAVMGMGLDAIHASSPPPERKGVPARSFVRIAPVDRPARTAACFEMADALVVFQPALARLPETFASLRRDATFVLNATPRFDTEPLAALPCTAKVLRIDALAIAAKEQSCPGAVLLGTLCGAFEFLDGEKVIEAFCEAATGGEEQAVAHHRKAFVRGKTEFQVLEGMGEAEGDLPAKVEESVAPEIGGVTTRPGSTAWNDRSVSRTGSLPAFNRERCIHCALCEMVCPDYCLVWEKGEPGGRFERELTGVDYRYCKGCLRCVESCPASALLKKAETPGFAAQRTVPLFPDVIE